MMAETQIPWQEAGGREMVFLLDYRGDLERRILMDGLHATAGERQVDAGNIVSLGYDTEPLRQQGLRQLTFHLVEGRECWFLPMRVSWLPAARQGRFSFRRLLGGNSHRPGPIRQRFIRLRDPGRCRVVIGEGASTTDLRERLQQLDANGSTDTTAFATFVSRQAMLALERAERNLRGTRYKVPRLIQEEVLAKPRLLSVINQEAERSGRSEQDLLNEAGACLQEMAAEHSPFALDVMAALGRYLYTRGFDEKIEFKDGDVERVKALSRQHPIAFLMTHKSHIDGFLLVTMFYDLDMTPVHLFGGINMSFFGLGQLGRKSGAIFIRRKMSGDNIYKAVFKQYIDYLAEKRFPLLWALEGTRSRTGKLMPPRFGLINYVVDSYVRQATTDMILMPVAIAYDQIPEVRDYIAEQKGVKKRPESASWFMQYISGLHHPFGKIHIRFGAGVRLSEVLGEPRADLEVTPLALQKIAFQLSVDANNVTPVLGTSIICFALSAAGGRALTLGELVKDIFALKRLVDLLQLPTTGDVDLATQEVLQTTLDQLVGTGVLVRYDEGDEPLYAISTGSTMAAAYYRNAMLHFLVSGAIAELAFLHLAKQDKAGRRQAFHDQALRIRDLLKFEFFFAEKQEFIAQLEAQMSLRLPNWETVFDEDNPAILRSLWMIDPLLAHGALLPFVDAYRVVAEALVIRGDRTVDDRREFLRECASLGRQRVLQRRASSEESAANVVLDNGLLLADSRGLLNGEGPGLEAQRRQLLEETTALVRELRLLASMADSRRLDLDLDLDGSTPNYIDH